MENKLRAILVDDEPLCTSGLEVDLKATCPEIEVVASCNSAKDGINAIKSLTPDVVFLDIEMPWMNGFELIKLLSPIDFHVIFVTAYDAFAVKAFQVHAMDYLMKPIDRDLLRSAVDRLLKSRNAHDLGKIESLLEDMGQKGLKKISLPNRDGIDIINISEILYCRAQGNYTDVHLLTETKRHVCRVLKEIAQQLETADFMRVHQSYLINMDHITSFHRSDGGFVQMDNGDRIPVSRANKSEIIKRLKSI